MTYLIIINTIELILMGIDKILAIKHKYRIPEIILLDISIFGGCFGCMLGMLIFHHKIRKQKFLIVIPITIIIYLLII